MHTIILNTFDSFHIFIKIYLLTFSIIFVQMNHCQSNIYLQTFRESYSIYIIKSYKVIGKLILCISNVHIIFLSVVGRQQTDTWHLNKILALRFQSCSLLDDHAKGRGQAHALLKLHSIGKCIFLRACWGGDDGRSCDVHLLPHKIQQQVRKLYVDTYTELGCFRIKPQRCHSVTSTGKCNVSTAMM